MYDIMYDNIGGKIKGLAKALFIIGLIGAVITGIILLANGYDGWYENTTFIVAGWILIIFGPIISWISSWILYGYGQLIDNTEAIVYNTSVKKEMNKPMSVEKKTNSTCDADIKKEINYKSDYIFSCYLCGKETQEGAYCKVIDEYGTRYRNVCKDCIEKNNDKITVVR